MNYPSEDRHPRERRCQEIGCVAAVCASRRAPVETPPAGGSSGQAALLSMREVSGGIKKIPHPEETAPSRRRLPRLLRTRRLSRRMHGGDPGDRRFPDDLEGGGPGLPLARNRGATTAALPLCPRASLATDRGRLNPWAAFAGVTDPFRVGP